MGQRVEVDRRVGHRRGVGADLGLDHLGVLQVRRRLGAGGELRGELAEAQVLALLLNQPEGRGVPEAGRPPVAEHDLVAVGEREELAHAGAHPAHLSLDRLLAVAGAHVGGGDAGERVDLGRPDLGGAGPETAVGGQQFGGNGDVGDVWHV